MLWKYADATVMVCNWLIGGLYGASGRYIQVGRRGRGCSLLRSGGAGGRKDRHRGLPILERLGAQHNRSHTADAAAGRAERPELHRIFDHVARPGTNLLRRRCDPRALESQPAASSQSSHHVTSEWPAAGFPTERTIVCPAAPGSRHLRSDRDHHRSANERIPNQQRHHILCASAFSAVAAVAAAQIALSSRPRDARLVS
jgi:hypothetical protein